MPASEQYGIPFNLPSTPFGSVAWFLETAWGPSAREQFGTRGLRAPAGGLPVPASKLGAWGCSASELTQPRPRPAFISKLLCGCASAPAGEVHGVRSLVLVKLPQVIGELNAAFCPLKKSSSKCSNGSCGFS